MIHVYRNVEKSVCIAHIIKQLPTGDYTLEFAGMIGGSEKQDE